MGRRTSFFTAGGVIFFFSILLIPLISLPGLAEERIEVSRVTEDFDFQRPDSWEQDCKASYSSTLSGDLSARLYLAYNKHYFYMGFFIVDPFLTFQDDYSISFQGSDHLRISFSFPEKELEERDLLLYLLPSSKIQAPLLNITGLAWRRSAFHLFSQVGADGYFAAIAVDCRDAGFEPARNPLIKMDCQIYNIQKDGSIEKHWFFGNNTNYPRRLIFK